MDCCTECVEYNGEKQWDEWSVKPGDKGDGSESESEPEDEEGSDEEARDNSEGNTDQPHGGASDNGGNTDHLGRPPSETDSEDQWLHPWPPEHTAAFVGSPEHWEFACKSLGHMTDGNLHALREQMARGEAEREADVRRAAAAERATQERIDLLRRQITRIDRDRALNRQRKGEEEERLARLIQEGEQEDRQREEAELQALQQQQQKQ
jgi:hypothetical protein